MAINKVEYNGKTLIDLTNDTVTDNTLIAGTTAHAADGEQIIGAFDPTIYLEKTGNASDVTTAFAQATARANIATGETLAISMGKIAKNFADIKGHAFEDTVNNLATTTKGSALDATQGKVLNDAIVKNASDISALNNNLTSKLDFFNLSNYDNSGILKLSKKQPFMGYIGWDSDNTPSRGNSCMVFGYDMIVIAISKPGGIYSISTTEPYAWVKRN